MPWEYRTMMAEPAPPRPTVPELRVKRIKRIERKGKAKPKAKPKTEARAALPSAESPMEALYGQGAQLEEAVRAHRTQAGGLQGIEDIAGQAPRPVTTQEAAVRGALAETPLGRVMYSRFLKDRRVEGEKGEPATLRIPRSATAVEVYEIIERLLETPGAQGVARALWVKYHA